MNFRTSTTPYCLGHVSFLDLASSSPSLHGQCTTSKSFAFDAVGTIAADSGPAITDTLRFVLSQSPANTTYLHLALFSAHQQLIHWVLPASSLPTPGFAPPAYLVEAPASLRLPSRTLDTGSCLLDGPSTHQVGAVLGQQMRGGRMVLTLSGGTLQGSFTLTRLHPSSHTWELSCHQVLLARRPAARAVA